MFVLANLRGCQKSPERGQSLRCRQHRWTTQQAMTDRQVEAGAAGQGESQPHERRAWIRRALGQHGRAASLGRANSGAKTIEAAAIKDDFRGQRGRRDRRRGSADRRERGDFTRGGPDGRKRSDHGLRGLCCHPRTIDLRQQLGEFQVPEQLG